MSGPRRQSIFWGVIGSGRAAQRFCDDLRYVPAATLGAVWSRSAASTERLATQGDAIACKSIEDLLHRDIDAVYIATLPDSHAEYSVRALQAGKHVLCEKPVAMASGELDRVLEVARRCDLLFMEAMKPPFFPLYRRLRRQLELDPIGAVSFVRAGYSTVAPPEHPSWALYSGGGGLMGIGVYQAFLAVDWMGEAYKVDTAGRKSPGGVDAFACVQTTHADGYAQIYSGLDLSGPGDAVLVGSEGYVTVHKNWWNPVAAAVNYRDGRLVELNEPIEGGGFNYETAHFCELVRNGARESPVMTHELSSQVMSLLDRARAELVVAV